MIWGFCSTLLSVSGGKTCWWGNTLEIYNNSDSLNCVIASMIIDQWSSINDHHHILFTRSCLRSVILHLESWKNWIYLAHFNFSTPLHVREIPPCPFRMFSLLLVFPSYISPHHHTVPPLFPPPPSTDLEFPDHPMVQLRRNNLHWKWISMGKMMTMVWCYEGYHHESQFQMMMMIISDNVDISRLCSDWEWSCCTLLFYTPLQETQYDNVWQNLKKNTK